jgi:hypothetical protein
MPRKKRLVALIVLLCLPACTSKWVKLPVTAKLTVMDADGDCGGIGCGPAGCPFVTKPSIPDGEVRVGYVYKNDDGTDPFPCWWYANSFLRGAVKFTLPAATEPNTGIVDGKLHYRASGVGGKPPCPVVRAAVATKPWSSENDFAITEDGEVFNQNIPLGAGVQTIKVSATTLAKWYLGQQPNHGFVFLGADESGGHKATKSCLAILSDFQLEILRTKKKNP